MNITPTDLTEYARRHDLHLSRHFTQTASQNALNDAYGVLQREARVKSLTKTLKITHVQAFEMVLNRWRLHKAWKSTKTF